METTTLHTSIPSEPLLTPLSHFPKQTPLTPLSLSPSPSLTSLLCSFSTPPLPSIVLNLSLCPPQPQMSLPCSEASASTHLLLSHPMANVSLAKPVKHLLFCSPLLKGKGVKQALAWNQEQLLDLRRLWELQRQQQIDHGLIPMAQPPTMISDAVLDVENRTSTATAIPPSFLTHHLTSPQPSLESQCSDPFWPTAWRGLTSIIHRPQHWQLASSMPLKTMKMPLRFRHPMTTVGKLQTSSQKGLGLIPPSLLKGWVYEVEEVRTGVKEEVVDPSQYQMLDALLTRSKCKAAEQLDSPYHQHRWVSNITEDPPSSPSISKRMAVKY
jgi:hypothetical protein